MPRRRVLPPRIDGASGNFDYWFPAHSCFSCGTFSKWRNERAEPGARANALRCHASCCCTSRATRGRGSSLTLGKMGWTFAGVDRFEFGGRTIAVAADGNNVAWICPECGAPILFVYLSGRRGSSPSAPSACACGADFSLDPPHVSPEPSEKRAPSQVIRIVQHARRRSNA